MQTLIELVALCEDCHKTCHLGKANADGRLEEACDRLQFINRFTCEETLMYVDWLFAQWEWRSNYQWMLDLSILANEPPPGRTKEMAVFRRHWPNNR
jgi:hypothetical protein